jgi:AbrB family looped-hinge helix DNA binding protein
MITSKVTTKGQVTLPKAIRERLQVHAGDKLAYEPQVNGAVIIRKLQPFDREWQQALSGTLAEEWNSPRTKRPFVTCESWDVVVVPFPFADSGQAKRRRPLSARAGDYGQEIRVAGRCSSRSRAGRPFRAIDGAYEIVHDRQSADPEACGAACR